ncbi:MAG: acyltransferase [Parolsenella sp.]|uniref:acyltransferase n=1 Tax=Parolsenella sp. TaxID=2083006 RepID=UPI002A75D24D|nr:acyltransferase [Parolsenella sp.]MCI5950133.1 acyltransferase [Coriobacteriaceae bacterium]MDY3292078.1 acyltransferase [Parolsenella sp.]
MTTKKVQYFDLLNIAACFSVVVLHCNQMVHSWQPGKNWLAALAIEVLFYWAVPVFFMLSGATLMRYRDRYDTRTFLKKRFKKTAIPFVAWSFVLYLTVSVPLRSAHLGPRTFIDLMLNNGIEQVYWFFFPLFSIYLTMPIISLIADQKRTILYGVVLSFALQGVFPYLFPALGLTWNWALSIPVFSGMLMYVGIGYLLATTDISAGWRSVIYISGIASMVFRFLYTAHNSQLAMVVDRTYFNYSAFPAVFQAMAVFTLAKQLELRRSPNLIPTRLQPAVTALSACSFGVYLIHKPVLDCIVLGLFNVSAQSIGLRTAGPIILYLSCCGVVYLAKKTRVGNLVFP